MKTTADFPKLTLPPCRLKVAERGGELRVWDVVRGRWLILTPEEWVRRHVLAMLTGGYGVAAASIAQEYPVAVNGQAQRADIVVFGAGAKPLMLIECKAPDVAVSRATLDQAFRYNAVLGARYVMLTNGLAHFIYEVTPTGEYLPLKNFPKL
ncbi:MAG: type I restriction enzyme HsdR N-terminal domain-containing protein [Alistipes sp.]|jgi:predicted type IV restriction endonuclease|nr:type I restriction enzyme HsdR N-terminal domain-containing protein [Alistipes sp.]